jgi:hypothetical protein
MLFGKNKKKCCLICFKVIKNYRYIYNTYFNNICSNCFENCINFKHYRKLKKHESNFVIYQNKDIINYTEPIYLTKFALYHPFGNIIRSVDLTYGYNTLKIELSQERIAYKRNRLINITDNILIYTHYYILNKTYDDIFEEILYYNYINIDTIFLEIFNTSYNTSYNCFTSIEKYKKIFATKTNISLLRLFNEGIDKNVLQNFANTFDEMYPYCNGQNIL